MTCYRATLEYTNMEMKYTQVEKPSKRTFYF